MILMPDTDRLDALRDAFLRARQQADELAVLLARVPEDADPRELAWLQIQATRLAANVGMQLAQLLAESGAGTSGERVH